MVGVGSDTLQYMLDFLADGEPTVPRLTRSATITSWSTSTPPLTPTLAWPTASTVARRPRRSARPAPADWRNRQRDHDPRQCSLRAQPDRSAASRPVACAAAQRLGCRFSGPGQDIAAGDNGPSTEVIDYSRASAAQSSPTSLLNGQGIDQLELATDTLPMLVSSGPNPTHAVPLSASQLSIIYAANTPNCITWSDPRIERGLA